MLPFYKRIAFAVFSLGSLLSIQADAQITLTAAANSPVAGLRHVSRKNKNIAAFVNPGAAGAGQVWNFASISGPVYDTLLYFNCNTRTNCSYYSANLVTGNAADTAYSYYRNTTASLQAVGFQTGTTQTLVTDPSVMYKYPFSYNSNYVDTTRYTAVLAGTSVMVSSIDSVRADGYGRLTTPSGTYQSTLRIRRAVTGTVTQGGQSTTGRTIMYQWFDGTSRYPLLTVENIYNPDNNGALVYDYSNTYYRISSTPVSVAQTAEQESSLTIHPNPAHGFTVVSLPEHFTLSDVRLTVTDLTGRVVLNQPLTKASRDIRVETAQWSKGLYMIRLQNNQQQQLTAKISVE